MNYRDYLDIMNAEGLRESISVKEHLESAIHWNKAIKNLDEYEPSVKKNLLKDFEERKIKAILLALDIARFEKNIGYRIVEDYDKLMEFIGRGGLHNDGGSIMV